MDKAGVGGMTEILFGRLEELSPREAWAHEAKAFTPWLADNIDRLSEAVGIPLELTGTEMAVESFAADVLARNPQDGTIVLIENQLEVTDHTHLGQIMTYLAGLEAQGVIWIAPRFREPHLSAIRWLNEHTADGFAFFAVRLRVVRIGDSPYAPIFEIVEQPNDWDRSLKHQASQEGSAYYDIKQDFWQGLLERHPDLLRAGLVGWRYSNNYITLREEPTVQISVWLGKTKSGVFVRSGWGEPAEPVSELLSLHRKELEIDLLAKLGPLGHKKHFLAQTFPMGHADKSNWPKIMDWMEQKVIEYRAALEPIVKGGL